MTISIGNRDMSAARASMKAHATRFAAALVIAISGVAAHADALPPPPAMTFFKHAEIEGASLSPSGRYLAIRSHAKTKRMALVVIDLEGQVAPTIAAAYSDADVRSFTWVTDDYLLYDLIDYAEGGAEQTIVGAWLVTSRSGSHTNQLIRASGRCCSVLTPHGLDGFSPSHFLFSVLHDGTPQVVIGQGLGNGDRDFVGMNLMRYNLSTGGTANLSEGRPDHAMRWLLNSHGEPRVIVSQWHGETEIWWRDSGDSKWRSLAKFASFGGEGFTPKFVDDSGHLYVVSAAAGQAGALRRYDVASGRIESQPMVSTPGFDYDGRLLIDDADGRILGLRVDTDAESTVWFDARMKAIQKVADERFPGRINRLQCVHCSGDAVVLDYSYSDQDPGSYWIYRTKAERWEPVGKTRPDVDPKTMATLDFERIKARDGEDLPVWVTRPKRAPGSPPPAAVVLVHGGPWVRGTYWRWNPQAQFLASRGYVVIEPEYRGSAGYGPEHLRRGFKAWGTTMQDDVADSVQWAADRGFIDRARVCIAGASYGGYAVLMGLIRHPEAYKCGVAWIAVTDPRLRYESSWTSDSTAETREYSLPAMVGDPIADAKLLDAATPVEHAAEIRAPLLMGFGKQDHRVPIEHGTRMREALRNAGRNPEYVVYDDEGHGWFKTENTVDWWNRVERFLSENLH